MTIYKPYSYLIGWSHLNLWYYGIEYGSKTKVANPSNLFSSYFTSCSKVHLLIEKEGKPDIIQVRKTFKTAEQAIEWEGKVLRRLRAASNPKWLNQNVKGSIVLSEEQYSEIGKKISLTKSLNPSAAWNKGLTKDTDKRLQKLSKSLKGRESALKGKTRSKDTKEKISRSLKGLTKSKDHIKKIQKSVSLIMNEKINCKYCEKSMPKQFIPRHEEECYLNPTHIKKCSFCGDGFVKRGMMFCSKTCSNKSRTKSYSKI